MKIISSTHSNVSKYQGLKIQVELISTIEKVIYKSVLLHKVVEIG